MNILHKNPKKYTFKNIPLYTQKTPRSPSKKKKRVRKPPSRHRILGIIRKPQQIPGSNFFRKQATQIREITPRVHLAARLPANLAN